VWREGRNIELGEITGCVVVDRTVRVQADGHRELVIAGLAHPSAFARLVWAVKRGFRADKKRHSTMIEGLPKEYAGWLLGGDYEDPTERPRQSRPDARAPVRHRIRGGGGEDKDSGRRGSSEAACEVCPARRGNKPIGEGVDPAWSGRLPEEARGLLWTDDYFDGDPLITSTAQIVAVFDFRCNNYYNLLGLAAAGFAAAMAWIGLPILLAVAPAVAALLCVSTSVRRSALPRQHAAVTTQGIEYVCEHLGPSPRLLPPSPPRVFLRERRVIPFDEITNCAVVERSMFRRIIDPLETVHIEGESEYCKGIAITDLKDPASFVRLVWAMKRGTRAPAGSADAAHEGGAPGPVADLSR
jgi:hypothetical protein